MIIAAPSSPDRPKNGPRPINLNTDIPRVLRLLELVFGASIDADGRQIFSGTAEAYGQPAFVWRFSSAASKLAMGFVWEDDDQLVGNVTVLTSRTPDRYLVVNVAVHPDYRRRGIARRLMEQVAQLIRDRQGKEIMLQVVKQNEAAISLYRSLDYQALGSMTNWYATMARVRPLEVMTPDSDAFVRELHWREWQEAYRLNRLALHPDLSWPDLQEAQQYKQTFWRRMVDFLNGRQAETWAVDDAHGALAGLGTIASEWGRAHTLSVRIHPSWRGRMERPLLAKLIRRLPYLPRRNVQIDHPDDDEVMNQLLREASFQPRRTLTHMRLTIDD